MQTRNATFNFRYTPPKVARLMGQSARTGTQEGGEIVTVRIAGKPLPRASNKT